MMFQLSRMRCLRCMKTTGEFVWLDLEGGIRFTTRLMMTRRSDL